MGILGNQKVNWFNDGNNQLQSSEPPSIPEEKIEYKGEKYQLGDIVSVDNVGQGVIFKELSDFNFWVAFPDIPNRLSSFPCDFMVYHAKDLKLENGKN